NVLIVAVLGQPTSWSNTKRVMDSLKKIYKPIFSHRKICAGRSNKIQYSVFCGQIHIRSTRIVLPSFQGVK
ncbi:hypothetical protein BS50DRAFT_479251, partial [Corynespora cassiicola Philippines]